MRRRTCATCLCLQITTKDNIQRRHRSLVASATQKQSFLLEMLATISNCSVKTLVSVVLGPCFQLCFKSCCVICRNSLAVHAGLLTEPPTLPTMCGVSQQHSVYTALRLLFGLIVATDLLTGCCYVDAGCVCVFSLPSCLILLHPSTVPLTE